LAGTTAYIRGTKIKAKQKTKKQLINELAILQRRIVDLEKSETALKQAKEVAP